MKDELVRFGVAMDASLLEEFDALVRARGGTRSEVLRDLARTEVQKSRRGRHAQAVGTLTLVYDHHVRDLTERLTEMQHALGEKVRSTLHVHLDHHRCLEVVVLRGFADELSAEAERLLTTRGVIHGALELYVEGAAREGKRKAAPPRGREHGHERGARHVHAHHADGRVHEHGPGHTPIHEAPAARGPRAGASTQAPGPEIRPPRRPRRAPAR